MSHRHRRALPAHVLELIDKSYDNRILDPSSTAKRRVHREWWDISQPQPLTDIFFVSTRPGSMGAHHMAVEVRETEGWAPEWLQPNLYFQEVVDAARATGGSGAIDLGTGDYPFIWFEYPPTWPWYPGPFPPLPP